MTELIRHLKIYLNEYMKYPSLFADVKYDKW
jgi:hypothetical protein